jgi:hypothetical protein
MWRSIETAPKDGTRVLLWARNCGFPGETETIMIGWFGGVAHKSWINDEPLSGWRATLGEIEGHDEDGYSAVDSHIVPLAWHALPEPPTATIPVYKATED